MTKKGFAILTVTLTAITLLSAGIYSKVTQQDYQNASHQDNAFLKLPKLEEKPVVLKKIIPPSLYEKEWKKIDSLEYKGLYKSAFEEVEKVIELAKAERNASMIVKAYLYQFKYNNYIEEYSYKKAVIDLEELANNTDAPTKQIIHSILAEVYWKYYSNNSWNIANRTELDDYDKSDMAEWPKSAFLENTLKNLYASIQGDELKKTPIQNIDPIIYKYASSDKEIDLTLAHFRRPTVYDFLAHRAIEMFEAVNFDIPRGNKQFVVDNVDFFGNPTEFVNVHLPTFDSLNASYHILGIYQDLTRHHLTNDNVEALLNVNLERLNYVKSQSILSNNDELYYQAIEDMIKKQPLNKIIAEYQYELANRYHQLASTYSVEDKTHQFDNKKALEICKRVLEDFPNTLGGKKCKYLINQIYQRSISLETESYILPESNWRYILYAKNVHKVYTKLVQVDYNEYKKKYANYNQENELLKFIRKAKPIVNKIDECKSQGDYSTHSYEFNLQGLEKGFYLLVASTNPEFEKNGESVSVASVVVSNLNLNVSNGNKGEKVFLVTDRTTGAPVEKAKIKLWTQKYNYAKGKYIKVPKGTISTNKNGIAKHNSPKDYETYHYLVSKSGDVLPESKSYYSRKEYKRDAYKRTQFFLDRAIYRPGQKLFFKGIVLKDDGNGNKSIATNVSTTVRFRDANYESFKEIKVKTNEFGSYSGSIEIPVGKLNGSFTILDNYGSKSFRVEEYKRPKFETAFRPFENEFQLNDSVEVIGFAKAFAGNMIDGAEVKYEVLRSASYPSWGYRCWGWFPPTSNVTIATGSTTSDDDGEYKIKFKAIPDLTINKKYSPRFNYTVKATVTDINGETHTAETNVRIGYVSMQLNTAILEAYQIKDPDSIVIGTSNLNGGKIKANGTYKIFKLKIPTDIKRPAVLSEAQFRSMSKEQFEEALPLDEFKKTTKLDWEELKTVQSGSFASGEKIELKKKKLGLGIFKIVALAKDKSGAEVKDINFFNVFDSKSKKAVTESGLLVKRLNSNENEPGDVAKFLVASQYSKYDFLVQIEKFDSKGNGSSDITRKWYRNQKGQQIIEIPITEKDRNGIEFSIVMNKNGIQYSKSQRVYVSQKHKQINADFVTFRDKLKPGDKEKWTVSLKSGYGEKVMAEMLASMYDKSLDEFASNYFNLSTSNYFYSNKRWNAEFPHNKAYTKTISNNLNNYVTWPSFSYPSLNYFGTEYMLSGGSYYSYSFGTGNGSGALRSAVRGVYTESDGLAQDAVVLESISISKKESKKSKSPGWAANQPAPSPSEDRAENEQQKGDLDDLKSKESRQDTGGLSEVKARTNFNETAFFYPHLMTNENGDVNIEFTIPESLTKWKFMAIAHTKDLKIGQLVKEVVTQKELMVVPNAPRFLREGDEITLSAKISNLTEDSLPSIGQLVLINPFNEEIITEQFNVVNTTQNFTVGPNKSTSISWNLKIPEGLGAVAYKIVAKGGKHSDGERNTLPILSNRMLVTESMPMSVRKAGKHQFTFDKLVNNSSNSLKHHNLTLEFTENPAWYAIQAMPYMMEYPYECAEQIFTRYYSNAIATHIMNSSPKIKEVIDAWKEESPDAFLSNLEKNQELKALFLEETPWVMQAKDESQRKKNIALLFDLARMERESDRALAKVKRKQTVNGGWPWFPGMKESRYITQHIVTGMGHLKNLKVIHKNERSVNQITRKGIEFLDAELLRDFKYLKRYHPDWKKLNSISNTQIQYLYARSYFQEIPIPKNVQPAFDYYMNSAKKKWLNQSLYTQGMLALAMHRFEETDIAKDIYKSLKERSISSKEFGRYWKEYNNSGYYWYQAPIETQAMMIELFDEVAKDEEMVEDLKVWLLKQKQTTDWKTTKATAEACYALLLRGTDVLTTSNNLEIFLGEKKVVYNKLASNPNEIGVKAQAGTGYFKHRFAPEEIEQSYGNVTIQKKDNTVSWGSLYWQYWEDLDKITFHKTPLHLEKQLFIVKNDGNGERMVKVEENNVKVGDKIRVRIVLRSDRNLEYVHLKDMRASGFEPTNVISRYKYKDGLGYYESTKDASTNFFFDYIPKGTYVFEYDLRVAHKGSFSNGIATIQCMYAPEFTSHSDGIRVVVK